MATLTQRAFSGGELSPSLRARVDLQKYGTAAATLRNFQVMRYGGASNRSGSQFVGEVRDSNYPVRLIPFVFNSSQSYILEFGSMYMRVIKNGSYVTDGYNFTVSASTSASPGVFSYTSTDSSGVQVGDRLIFNGGYSALTNRPVIVASRTSSTFTLTYLDGTAVNTGSLGAFSATSAKRVYTLLTPYGVTDLPTLQYIQSADVVTIVHHNYIPRKLSRTGDAAWTLATYTFEPVAKPPALTSSTAGGSGTIQNRYRATTIDKNTGEESLLSTYLSHAIQSITKANPAVVTTMDKFGVAEPHGYLTGDSVTFDKITSMTELSEKTFTITVVDANRFSLNGVDSTNYGTYVQYTGGVSRYYWRLDSAQPTTTAPNKLVFNATNFFSTGYSAVNVYKEKNGIFGFLGTASVDSSGNATFNDVGLEPDTSDLAPAFRNPFNSPGAYPATVAYIQQRLVFANTNDEPEKVWTSRVGQFNNFTISSPSQDDQAITFTMAGRQVNAVRYLLDVGQFLVLTSGGEWAIQGDNGILTPVGINPKQYTYYGSAEGLPPIIIGNSALFTQARGSLIRDLAYNYESNGYSGNDLTVFSSHLFDKFTIKDWCYQQIPHSIVWVVRDDGTLLGLTYLKEQQMLAWHRHDTDGAFENVMAIPEGNEDALYAVVRRVVNGRTVRYVERFATRKVLDLRDAKYCDSYLSYDGRNPSLSSTTLTLSGGTTWTSDELLTLSANQSFFVSTDVGNQIQFTDLRFTITEFTSATTVKGYAEKNVPVALRGVVTSTFTKAVKKLSGLWHLEGKAVSVLGDGYTVSSPNNPQVDTVTVVNGGITLDKPYGVITVGLPYVSDLETLEVDTVQSETLADKRMIINKVTLSMEESVGGFVGAQAPSASENMIEHLMEMNEREYQTIASGNAALTGRRDVAIEGNWQTSGRIFIRQVDPLPLSVLSVSIAGLIPLRQG